ncbi:MAG: pilus assembly PilX N-terminal domain-containing protein [Candidatus Omnitrophica bacterium]|nr:pilus assembly PilX N-terminal domain-containing protein [Candidatus Omnitrophota bacterium]
MEKNCFSKIKQAIINKIVPQRKKRNNKGIALLLALIVMVILFMLSTTYLSTMLSESGIARNQENGEKAFFVAEAGIDRAMRLIVETPKADTMPWSYQENMTDGYYIVTVAEATDIGEDFVRIISTGYVGAAQRTTEAIIYLCAWKFLLMSNTNITFADTAIGSLDGDIHANNSVLGLGIESGFHYVDGSRDQNSNSNLIFDVKNETGATLTLTQLTATWTTPTAYYTEVSIRVSGGTNYGTVWDSLDNGGNRAASGEMINFDEPVLIANNATAQISLEAFSSRISGNINPQIDMDNTTFNITFSDGSTFYPVSVGLASSSAANDLEIDGDIAQGSLGDPLVSMPSVDLLAYRNRATKFFDGDYTFNGLDSFVDSVTASSTTANYKEDSYYITGKVIINSYYKNLSFPRCMITAVGGIEIINEYRPSGLDYIDLTRIANTNSDVEFQIRNNSDVPLTITGLSIAWDPPPNSAAYENIRSKVQGQAAFITNWTFPPPSGRAENSQTVILSPAISLNPGQYADMQIDNFCKFSSGKGNEDMDNEVFSINFYTAAKSYQTIVFRAGEVIVPTGGRIFFRQWRPEYPTLITKDGDIIESGVTDPQDRDFDGILFSENGIVDLETFKLEGCIVANEIILRKALDLEYKPIMVPDPPPDFIAGISFIKWQENY